jgi:2-polyprenyl-3-methyl-5-hydroxy-6-metoxy-1,4-benzoquinol methylase
MPGVPHCVKITANAIDLYERHWWWRARERAILNVLRSRQPGQGWKGLLDVGCGEALFFDELAHFGEVEGVEPEESLISPDSPHRARIHVGNFDRPAQLAGEFSVVLMLDALEHLADPVAETETGASRRRLHTRPVDGAPPRLRSRM